MARKKADAEPLPPIPIVDESVTLKTYAPAKGDYRVLVAVVDDQGRAKHVDFTLGPMAYHRLTERYSWDQYFYPAMLRLTA